MSTKILLILASALLVGCDRADGSRVEQRDPQPAPGVGELADTASPEFPAGLDIDTTVALHQPADDLVPRPPPSPSASTVDSEVAPSDPPDSPAFEPLPTGSEANDILERAERAYAQIRSMEADFIQEVYVPLLDATRQSRGKIYHRAPDRFAMRFTDPQGDVIVADGRYIWMYHPSTDPRQVMRSRLTEGGQQIDLQREFLSNATERYAASRTGGESVGGRSTHALTLTPRGPSPYRRIRIWVDAQDFLVRRFEIVEENESVRQLEMANLRPNASIPDDIFEFEPPANAQIYEP